MGMRLGTFGLAIALAIVTWAGDASAKKPQLSVRIHGHVLKAHGRRLQVFSGPTLFEIAASAGPARFNRAMAVACVAFDLAHTPLPTTLQCNGNYQETRVHGRHASVKVWSTSTNIQVTIEEFDGTHARGTFSGTFEFSPVGDPPASVQNGSFDAGVTLVGG